MLLVDSPSVQIQILIICANYNYTHTELMILIINIEHIPVQFIIATSENIAIILKTYVFICKYIKHNQTSCLQVPCILLPVVSSPVLLSLVFRPVEIYKTAATHIGSTTAAATLTVSLTADNYLLLLLSLH